MIYNEQGPCEAATKHCSTASGVIRSSSGRVLTYSPVRPSLKSAKESAMRRRPAVNASPPQGTLYRAHLRITASSVWCLFGIAAFVRLCDQQTPQDRQNSSYFVHHPRIMDLRCALFSVSLIALGATPGATQSLSPKPQPCPQASQSGPTGNSANNPASHQGVENSAIVPDAGSTDESAAPTVKKGGQDVEATECPKPPNQLNDASKRN